MRNADCRIPEKMNSIVLVCNNHQLVLSHLYLFIFRHDRDLFVIQCITNIVVNNTNSGESLRPDNQQSP